MNIRQLRFTAEIRGSTETVFQLIADMPNYGKWLPNSSAFGGTIDVRPYPVRLGTTYLDAGPIEKPGVVTAFDPPTHIAFRHTVQLRQNLLNTDVDADIQYIFAPRNGKTFVERLLTLRFNLRGVQRLLLPVVLYGFRVENVRTLAALKRHVEKAG